MSQRRNQLSQRLSPVTQFIFHLRRQFGGGTAVRGHEKNRIVTKAGDKPTADEAKAALDGVVAYFGKYSVDETARTVTHHRQGSVQPGDKGDLIRGYEFVGDRLILRPLGTTTEVHWERIK